MKHRWKRTVMALICTGGIIGAAWLLPQLHDQSRLPGLKMKDRTLLRIWVIGSPGGGQAWLKGRLQQFEKQHPQVSTYLRTVPAEELSAPEAVIPDVVLYLPGDLQDPASRFLPLTGDVSSLLREELLRCGRWQNQQYGLPLCWSAWALAIDSALEPGTALTPAPTTLLGRPAATAAASTPEPAYPLEAARQADCALQSPGGAALFTLMLLDVRPPLPDDFGTLSSADVYAAFQRRQCATAVLTTGQLAAFSGTVSGGSGFPFRVMTADEVITDQVWLASITPDAPAEATLLLSHLVSADAQKALVSQSLHTVRRDLALYAAGTSARVESAARTSLSAVNAYIPAAEVHSAAWRCFQGQLTLAEALLPLM
ncbi:MAG: hypothetical protein IKL25_08780 [Clostridia bacterium]|nr:hypothetical protein [Clostridia bacterium]